MSPTLLLSAHQASNLSGQLGNKSIAQELFSAGTCGPENGQTGGEGGPPNLVFELFSPRHTSFRSQIGTSLSDSAADKHANLINWNMTNNNFGKPLSLSLSLKLVFEPRVSCILEKCSTDELHSQLD